MNCNDRGYPAECTAPCSPMRSDECNKCGYLKAATLPDREKEVLKKALGKCKEAIALLNSMVLSGERHSEISLAVVRDALSVLDVEGK